jgi:hypothetical protein
MTPGRVSLPGMGGSPGMTPGRVSLPGMGGSPPGAMAEVETSPDRSPGVIEHVSSRRVLVRVGERPLSAEDVGPPVASQETAQNGADEC